MIAKELIRISEETKNRLIAKKRIARETFDDVVVRMLDREDGKE